MGWGAVHAPKSWTLCSGQTLPLSQFPNVFSLIGTIYGGDGRASFQLPDLRGRVPIGAGQSPGSAAYQQGQVVGAEAHTITSEQMPAHRHSALPSLTVGLFATTSEATTATPADGLMLAQGQADVENATGPARLYAPAMGKGVELSGPTISGSVDVGVAGRSEAMPLMQPSLAIHFIFCLYGLYPPRN